MIFKGTDIDAFRRASSGLTKKARSRKYKQYKAQNEKKREREAASSFSSNLVRTPKIPQQQVRRQLSREQTIYGQSTKYIEKKTILDDVRNCRSSKIVSNISNSLATFVVKCGGRQWDNNTKNVVRSSIALAISEVTNNALERPLEVIDNIKLFIKVGKTIYKITAWINKITKLWTTDDKSISIVAENDIEYISYLRKYPRLAQPVRIGGMKYKVGDIVLLKNGRIVRIVHVNVINKTYRAVGIAEDKTECIITDTDIYGYSKHL